MNILLFLIPITFILGLVGVFAFLWNVKNKQYEDLEGAANRILFESDLKEKTDVKKDAKKNDSQDKISS